MNMIIICVEYILKIPNGWLLYDACFGNEIKKLQNWQNEGAVIVMMIYIYIYIDI